jgi:D-inositol-3-phosphate glycosyltransferase
VTAAEFFGPDGPPAVRRVAVLSVHTCPLDQPGMGDSGGMNVYVRSVARRLAEIGLQVDVFTRRAAPDQGVVDLEPGVRVVHLEAGPPRPIAKEDLAHHLCEFVCALVRFGEEESARLGIDSPAYDVIHSHYWLSGAVGRLVRERWGVPLVHSFHTLALVKNGSRTGGEAPEPSTRVNGEQRVANSADVLLAPTLDEAGDLARLYGASPERIRVVPPGVDSSIFTPGADDQTRAALGIGSRAVVLFVGRLQPLKRPDLAVRSVAELAARRPDLDPVLIMVGGPSGQDGIEPAELEALAKDLGAAGRVRVLPPVPHDQLPSLYRAADVLIVPSRSESFGLVALEAASCGLPVVATDVGGLRTTVRDGVSGILVRDDSPPSFANAIERVLLDPATRAAMGSAGRHLARRFDWRQSSMELLAVYEEAASQPDAREAQTSPAQV